MNKIDLKFKELREKNEKALIPFIALGDKSLDETVEMVQVLEKALEPVDTNTETNQAEQCDDTQCAPKQ